MKDKELEQDAIRGLALLVAISKIHKPRLTQLQYVLDCEPGKVKQIISDMEGVGVVFSFDTVGDTESYEIIDTGIIDIPQVSYIVQELCPGIYDQIIEASHLH